MTGELIALFQNHSNSTATAQTQKVINYYQKVITKLPENE